MVGAVGFKRSIDPDRQGSVRYGYPTPFARDWKEKEMDDELRENGVKFDVAKGGFNILEYIGFEMELSSKLARGQFTINDRASEENGELNRGLIEYIAESIASAGGLMSSASHNVLGIELNVNHLQPAFVGQHVTVIAKPLKQGKRVQVWEMKFETRDKTNESTTGVNVDPSCETVLIAIARFTLVVQTPAAVTNTVIQSKL